MFSKARTSAPETQLILDSVRRIVRSLRVSSRALEKSRGLTAAQLFVLQKLGPKEPVSVNELARRTFTHQSSVSAVVTKLVERGLVTRKPSKDDARRMDITVTDAALSLLRSAPEPIQDRLVAGIAALGKAERAALARHLSAVVEMAGLADAEPPLFLEDGT